MEIIDKEKDYHDNAYTHGVRKDVDKFYSIIQKSYGCYEDQLLPHSAGKSVLEYGCGTGSYAFALAAHGAIVTGIDISDIAIRQARTMAEEKHLAITFTPGNAEQLEFPERSFDIICGTGILHHLNLSKAYAEIARTLNEGGKAVFYEPLGHNFFINWYRKRTPHLRTEDEHPLLQSDLEHARMYFGSVDLQYFHLLSLLAVPFHKRKGFSILVRMLDACDKALLTVLPGLKKYLWVVVITLSRPKPQRV
jgi:SAM-dependent methyltransferase